MATSVDFLLDDISEPSYKEAITPLRERIDRVDEKLIDALKSLQDTRLYALSAQDTPDNSTNCISNVELSQATQASPYHPIFTTVFWVIGCRELQRPFWTAHKSEILSRIESISTLLDERFAIVSEIAEVKKRYWKPSNDPQRFEDLKNVIKERWTEGNKIIDAVWEAIHDHAKEIEDRIKGVFQSVWVQVETCGREKHWFRADPDSSVFRWHFWPWIWIAPGVFVAELLAWSMERNNTLGITTSFRGQLQPWDTIALNPKEYELTNLHGNTIATATAKQFKDDVFDRLIDSIWKDTLPDSVDTLNTHLPQKPPFRFATSGRPIGESQYVGYWDIPRWFKLSQQIAEESAAQILSLAYGKERNPHWGYQNNGTILLYQKSEIRWNVGTEKLSSVKRLRVQAKIWKIRDQNRADTGGRIRLVPVSYIVSDETGAPLFEGKIIWNEMPWNDFRSTLN